MNILFIGSSGALSLIPLAALKASGHLISAIATNDISRNELSTIISGTIQSFSLEHEIPLINLNKKNDEIIAKIKSYQPDIILVSCYDRLIPESVLSSAKLGAFNLHPSFLPLFRGPTPLFWQFREGVDKFGVTLHSMSNEFDAGYIVSQKSIQMPEGISIQEATELIANSASELILDFLDDLSNKTITKTSQNESLSSYQSYPKTDDYRVSTSWAAKRIYNFICAYKEQGVFFLCRVGNSDIKIIDVVSYENDVISEHQYIQEGDIATLACDNGSIKCRIKLD